MLTNVLSQALQLIRSTRGYAEIGIELAQMASENRIRFDANLEDRAQAGLLGTIILGPEAAESSALSLAQTLVHEYFHLRRQHPLLKTASFWGGVLSRTPVMRRYEQPAYQAALDFLRASAASHPHLAAEAQKESEEICGVFENSFGASLQ